MYLYTAVISLLIISAKPKSQGRHQQNLIHTQCSHYMCTYTPYAIAIARDKSAQHNTESRCALVAYVFCVAGVVGIVTVLLQLLLVVTLLL